MDQNYTSQELAKRLHDLTHRLPGFKYCNAETQTTVVADGQEWHWVKLSFWAIKGLRSVGHVPFKTQQEAIDNAFLELEAVMKRASRIPHFKAQAA
ncbi:hypothetical protein [Rufibacter quisquiliarum]|uniref:Uncharacterized protein n=1 Tax=Rufibacter quisquiliarum TaxID=1549639 RepID=A0A839GX37_9BACT|nr:hypothetical protein [Rufibacter quisquiliarum]MBA9078291.1 hypothetical protein [Rufibacter quisquiliarum]